MGKSTTTTNLEKSHINDVTTMNHTFNGVNDTDRLLPNDSDDEDDNIYATPKRKNTQKSNYTVLQQTCTELVEAVCPDNLATEKMLGIFKLLLEKVKTNCLSDLNTNESITSYVNQFNLTNLHKKSIPFQAGQPLCRTLNNTGANVCKKRMKSGKELSISNISSPKTSTFVDVQVTFGLVYA